MLKIDARKKEKKRSSLCVRYNRARFLRFVVFTRVFSRKTTFYQTTPRNARTNERTNERNQFPPKETLLRRTSFNLSTASNAARPLVVDPEKPEPPLEEDEDEGRPDDALEEEGLPNSLLNMMNICERKNWWFFFVREKRCRFTKRKRLKRLERDEKRRRLSQC